MKKLILALGLLATPAMSAHLSKNIRCVDTNEVSKISMKFVVVKANKLHRFIARFEALKGNGFNIGDILDIAVDGEIVGTMKLRRMGKKKVRGLFRKQGFDPDFPIDVDKGSEASVADLACVFKR